VDASIIAAPAPRKNRKGEHDPEMKQSKKGNQWHFGMKLHMGMDDPTGRFVSGVMQVIRGLRRAKPIRIARWPGILPWGLANAGHEPETNWRG